MKPSLSIIIPVYNVEQYLKKCLDSVLVDNMFTGQIICVNDGSTDNSLKILEQYAEKYPNVVIISQPNAGLSVARNTGLDKAIGDYIFFLDSDDWIVPASIDRVLGRIGGEDVIYFNAKKYDESNQTYDVELGIPEFKHLSGQDFFAAINNVKRNVPWVCVVGGLYKRIFLQENHLYNEPGIYHEDSYFTPQVLLAAKDVSSVNEYVYNYRLRKGSITTSVSSKHISDSLFIMRNLYATYKQQSQITDVFYHDVCNGYITLIDEGYKHNIPVAQQWKNSDSRIMLRCAYGTRSRKIAKLTYLSTRIAYQYMTDTLPVIWRRLINKFL